MISPALASTFAKVALANVAQEYPNKLDHVMNDASEVRAPRELHPVFYGSYDWHSCVHMHWTLARLLRTCPRTPEAGRIEEVFDRHFTAHAVEAEIAYLKQPSRQSFERTYGWAWLLKLQSELLGLSELERSHARWALALQPLADAFVERYLRFLPFARYPIRTGTHANSAFGLYFALDYAGHAKHDDFEHVLKEKAKAWFTADASYPAAYEPGGDDFLSGGLMEAALMSRVLNDGEFARWWDRFSPDERGVHAWLRPVEVSDRSDPKLAHLDGLNLSRAWCWKTILPHLPAEGRAMVAAAAERHLSAALPHAQAGDYAGTHWLASFALLALSC